MAKSERFYDKGSRRHSEVKSEIAVKYFIAWSHIIRRQRSHRVVYLDLFAGPGDYEDGTPLTPPRLLDEACRDDWLRDNLVSIFNDSESDYCERLRQLFREKGYSAKFANVPVVRNREVDSFMADHFEESRIPPTFCFIDPCGYKGLSYRLVQGIVKNWGCDCLVFFSTSGIIRNIDKKSDMRELFGFDEYDRVLSQFQSNPRNKPRLLVESFSRALISAGAKHCLSFQFNRPKSLAASHHLLFVTKNDTAFKVMKDIMAEPSVKEDGIPTWTFIEGCENEGEQLGLRSVGRMAEFQNLLSDEFAGKTVSVERVLSWVHSESLRYTEKNVRDAIKLMAKDTDRRVVLKNPSGRAIRKGTLGNKIEVHFSEKGNT